MTMINQKSDIVNKPEAIIDKRFCSSFRKFKGPRQSKDLIRKSF